MPQSHDHVVILGGTRGLGFDLAKACVARGSRVTIVGRDREAAREAAASIGDAVTGMACDLTDWPSIASLFAEIDMIDHLLLTAIERDANFIESYRPEDAARLMLIKNVGYAEAVHQALPKLAPKASVLLFGGLTMSFPLPGSTTLSMVNAGLEGLMKSLAVQISPVRVNLLTPGIIVDAFDRNDEARTKRLEVMREKTPGGHLPNTQNIIDASFALMDNTGINAENLIVDGGMSLAR